MADEANNQDVPETNAGADVQDQAGQEPLGEPGKKALQSEREARRAAEKQVSDLQAQIDSLKPLQDQMSRLTEVFGEKSGQSSSDDIVADLQKQMAALQHDNLVNSVARQYKIESDDDVALLRGITDKGQLVALAARLAAPAASSGPVTPRPDPSVGKGGGSAKPTSLADAIASHYN